MSECMEASVLRLPDKFRISYDVPHRIFSSKIYPSQAPNGSTVVIYGHEHGIRILWRGGRKFKTPLMPTGIGKPAVNGSSREDAMVLDSDDDEPGKDDTVPSISSFEEVEEERDASESYEKLLRHVDICFGTCARHIAVPHIPAHIRDSAPGAYPPILLSNIVVAAACEDSSIKMITLPMLPPRPSTDERLYKWVQVLTISGTNSHKAVPSSIAITHSSISDPCEIQRHSSKSRSRSRNRPDGEESTTTGSDQPRRSWCFLLVSSSSTAGGLLLTHQVPLISDTEFSTSPSSLRPIHRCSLGSPCLNSKVVFNPAAFPADRHCNVLVSTADGGSVKLYQVSPENHLKLSRSRRGSAATTDSASSDLRPSQGSLRSRGNILITLHPGFVRSSSSSNTQRKRILDVAWVSAGRAIFALLEDGEWGVWDLEGVGPGPVSGSANLIQGQRNGSGIKGGAMNRFSFTGLVMPTTEALSKTRKTESGNSLDGRLAPMTPHTRRVRSGGLFRGEGALTGIHGGDLQPIQGLTCVTERASSNERTLTSPEESLVVAHGSSIIYISSLQALWRAETSTKGTLDSVDTVRPFHCQAESTGEDRLVTISELPHRPHESPRFAFGTKTNQNPDLLVVGDRRLTFFVSPLTDSTHAGDTQNRYALRLGKAQQPTEETFDDEVLLGRGQLDLEGMGRILDGMGNQDGTVNGHAGPFGKKVAFDLADDDEDVSMSSPTPRMRGRSSRIAGKPSGQARRMPLS